MKKIILLIAVTVAAVCFVTTNAQADDTTTTISSSTMVFKTQTGYTLTETSEGSGIYTGVLPMVEVEGSYGDGYSGYDLYAKNGATAWFGQDNDGDGTTDWSGSCVIGDNGDSHDPFPSGYVGPGTYPNWDPDTPDWYQYSVSFYEEDGQQKWAVRNHAGGSEADPWYNDGGDGTDTAKGVPMSGTMDWTTGFAAETDVGAYLPNTGTPEVADGDDAESQGGGAQAWDMDWSWGSEMIPLEYPGFDVEVFEDSGDLIVTMTPAPEPASMLLFGSAMAGGLAAWRRKKNKK